MLTEIWAKTLRRERPEEGGRGLRGTTTLSITNMKYEVQFYKPNILIIQFKSSKLIIGKFCIKILLKVLRSDRLYRSSELSSFSSEHSTTCDSLRYASVAYKKHKTTLAIRSRKWGIT